MCLATGTHILRSWQYSLLVNVSTFLDRTIVWRMALHGVMSLMFHCGLCVMMLHYHLHRYRYWHWCIRIQSHMPHGWWLLICWSLITEFLVSFFFFLQTLPVWSWWMGVRWTIYNLNFYKLKNSGSFLDNLCNLLVSHLERHLLSLWKLSWFKMHPKSPQSTKGMLLYKHESISYNKSLVF